MGTGTSDKLRGVFSSQEIRKVGTGTTTRKTVAKTFWYVEEEEDGRIYVLPINSNYVPTGNKKYLSRDELLEKFSPEPEFYIQSVYPKMRALNETIDRADKAREKGEVFSAEFEYDSALKVDEENVRANFGIGLTYLTRGETDKAENIFERLLHLDAAFEEEHKYLFNDFGINLRKNKMYDQALEYYLQAENLSKSDDNLFTNIARVYLEQNDIKNCIEYLVKALLMNQQNPVALKFLGWLEEKKKINPEQSKAIRDNLKAHSGQIQTPDIEAAPDVEATPIVGESPASEGDAPASVLSTENKQVDMTVIQPEIEKGA